MTTKIEKVQEEFNVRYYYWALEDFKREIEQEFPFLSSFTSGSDFCVVQMMSQMTSAEKLFFAKALVKRFHKKALAAIGDSITTDEQQLCEEYSLKLNEARLFKLRSQLLEKHNISLKRKRLKKAVVAQFEAMNMQLTEVENGDGVWSHTMPVEPWHVITRFYTRNKHSQLAYDHAVWSVSKVRPVVFMGEQQMWPVQIAGSINLNSWLGISSQTEWDELEDYNLVKVARDVGRMCSHFLQIVLKLLKGLSV